MGSIIEEEPSRVVDGRRVPLTLSSIPCLLDLKPKFLEGYDSYGRRLTAECESLMAIHYAAALSPHIEGGYNQMEYSETIERNVRSLLWHGSFLRGGIGRNVFISYFSDLLNSHIILWFRANLWTLETRSLQISLKASTITAGRIASLFYSQKNLKSFPDNA